MVKIGDAKIKSLYLGGAKIKKDFIGEDLIFGETKPSRLPEGYTEVEYIHLSGAVGFQTNYRATPSVVRVLFDMQMEAYSGKTERLFYQYGTAGASTVDYYFTLSRYSESQFRIMPGTLSGKYNILSTGSVTGERITIDANIPLKKVTIGGFSGTIPSGITSSFDERYLYIFGGSSAQYAPTSNLYSCKVYVSGSLKFDFVPCTNPSGVDGLFDLVGSKFYANSFGGTITAGPAV